MLAFARTVDILAQVAGMAAGRPRLVVGFAAETGDVAVRGAAKRARKGCDWIVANDVSPGTGIMGGTENAVVLVDASGAEAWPRLSKGEGGSAARGPDRGGVVPWLRAGASGGDNWRPKMPRAPA